MHFLSIILSVFLLLQWIPIVSLFSVADQDALSSVSCNTVQFPEIHMEDSINAKLSETMLINDENTPFGLMHLVATFTDTAFQVSNSDILQFSQTGDTVLVEICATGVSVDFDVDASIPVILSEQVHGLLTYDSIKGVASYLIGCDSTLDLLDDQYLNHFGADIVFTGGGLGGSLVNLISQLYLPILNDLLDRFILDYISSLPIIVGPIPPVEITGDSRYCPNDTATFYWENNQGLCDVEWSYSGHGNIIGDPFSSSIQIDFTEDESGGELIFKVRSFCNTTCDTISLTPLSPGFCSLPVCDGDSIFISDTTILMNPDTIRALRIIEIDRILSPLRKVS